MRNTSALHWTLLVALLGSPGCASAQKTTNDQEPVASPPSPPITTIAQSEQLGVNVAEAFQDRDGNYWFSAGGAGVCRYDGKSLTYFREEIGTGVEEILQDEDGAICFATQTGVSCYENGKFTKYTVANGLSHNRVWSMMLDSAGTLWAGTQGGVCRFDGKSFVPFPIPRAEVENPYYNLSPLLVWGIAEDQDGNLWFGMDGEGVRKFDGESFTTYTTKDGLAGNNVLSVYADRRGRMWFGTRRGGVSCYDGTTFRNFTKKDGLNNNYIWAILEDSAGNMWFSTIGAGACRYDGKSFTAFREDQGLMINGFPAHAHVQDMFEDKDGILWFACSGGLFYLDGESFINVTKNGPWPASAQKPAPPGPAATEAPALLRFGYGYMPKGRHNGGVRKFDGESFTTYTTKEGLVSNNVRSVYADRRGRMWFGTAKGGVSCYDGTAFRNFTEKDGLTNNSICGILA